MVAWSGGVGLGNPNRPRPLSLLHFNPNHHTYPSLPSSTASTHTPSTTANMAHRKSTSSHSVSQLTPENHNRRRPTQRSTRPSRPQEHAPRRPLPGKSTVAPGSSPANHELQVFEHLDLRSFLMLSRTTRELHDILRTPDRAYLWYTTRKNTDPRLAPKQAKNVKLCEPRIASTIYDHVCEVRPTRRRHSGSTEADLRFRNVAPSRRSKCMRFIVNIAKTVSQTRTFLRVFPSLPLT